MDQTQHLHGRYTSSAPFKQESFDVQRTGLECITTEKIEDIVKGQYEILTAHLEALFSTPTGKKGRTS